MNEAGVSNTKRKVVVVGGKSDKNAYFSGISHTNSCFKQDYFDKVDRVCRTPGDDPEMVRNTIMYNQSRSATGM